ncbi:MAG: hypothetical protein ACI8UO_004544 [Verrucomicrobiales bacterium]|jgi:hypothetical protein
MDGFFDVRIQAAATRACRVVIVEPFLRMAIRNWGDEDEVTESENEKMRKKAVGPGFWVALLVVLAASPWLIQIPGIIRDWRLEKALEIPAVCGQQAYALIERERDQPSFLPLPADIAPTKAEELKRPAVSEDANTNPESTAADSGLKLLAFSLAVPAGGDAIAPGRGAVEMLEFFDPNSLAPIPQKQLLDFGADDLDLAICKANIWHPVLRLVFQKSSAADLAENLVDSVTDRRTGFRVEGEMAPVIRETRQLLVMDSGIGIWHDTPLTIEVKTELGVGTFAIEGLPTAPNGRDVDDLFDIRIPRTRIWFRAGNLTPELDFIRAATELHGGQNFWPYRPSEAETGDWIPADHYDVSIRELTEKHGRRFPLKLESEAQRLRRIR